MTHYIIITKVEESSAEYFKLRALIEKFTMHFHIFGTAHHLTTLGEPIPLDVLRTSVQEAIGAEATCYVGQLADYCMTPKPEPPATTQG